MIKQLIEEFVNIYNEFVNLVIDDAKKHDVDLGFCLIETKKKFISTNKLEQLVYNYYFPNDTPIEFLIIENEIKKIGNYNFFARNSIHDLYYAYSKNTNEIVAMDDSGETIYYVAKDIEHFFKIMIKVISYKAIEFKGESKLIKKDFKILNKLAGGNKYTYVSNILV
ncbi:hypothetical protein [Flammeovirga aprica]|uniref:Uncharacterized protein n=1 Tax=Flammeovirga aprica JL-4 TaxID=694437 RepID=A0A7X9RZQ2_9BACT|nr:hypothetical protein [Flammeovirga aprica]NME71701.1 hypothetical protein [Flammeovirga aprica JL-4]